MKYFTVSDNILIVVFIKIVVCDIKCIISILFTMHLELMKIHRFFLKYLENGATSKSNRKYEKNESIIIIFINDIT